MSQTRIQDVFNVREVPNVYSYVERRHYLSDVLTSLAQGLLVNITGASKSGKTWLARRAVGSEKTILVEATILNSADDFWRDILSQLDDLPANAFNALMQTNQGRDETFFFPALKKRKDSLPTVAPQLQKYRYGIAEEVQKESKVVIIDNFHTIIDSKLQDELIGQLELLSQYVPLIVILVSEQSARLPNYNARMSGRVNEIQIEPWTVVELKEIAFRGEKALNTALIPPDPILDIHERLALESLTSPFIMQLLCANILFAKQRVGHYVPGRPIIVSIDDILEVAGHIAKGLLVYQSDYNVLSGLRKDSPVSKYRFDNDKEGTLQQAILTAISRLAVEGSRLEIPLDEIKSYVKGLLKEENEDLDKRTTDALAVMQTQYHDFYSNRFSAERATRDPVISYDPMAGLSLIITDPFFIFFVRHSPYVASMTEIQEH